MKSDRLSRLVRPAALVLAAVGGTLAWLWLQFPGYLGQLFTAIPGEVWGYPTSIGGGGYDYYGGDQVQILYLAWKLKQNLVHHWSLFTDHFTFASRTGVLHDLCFGPQLWLIALVSLFVGDVAAYNLGFIVLPIAFTFLSGYYLFGAATSSRWARALLAAGLSIVPLRLVEIMMGHSTGSVWWLVPLYWGVVVRHRLERAGRWGDAVAGLLLFITVVAEEHQAMYQLIASAMVFLVWGIQDLFPLKQAPRAIVRLLARWKYLVAGVAALGGYGMFYRKMLLIDYAGHSRAERPFWDIRLYSQPLREFIGLDGGSNVGAWLVRALPLALVALVVFARLRPARLLRSPYLAFALSLPILLFLTLGLGPDWSQQTGIYEWFYAHVPFFSAQRVSIKLFTVCATFMTLLAAAAYEAVATAFRQATSDGRRPARIGLGVTLSIVAGAIALQPIQYMRTIKMHWPGLLLTDMRWGPRGLFFYMRNNLSLNDIVLTVPFNVLRSRWETYPDYFAYRTRVRYADGYFGQHPAYFDLVADDISSFNDGAPSPKALALAKELGYTYLLLNLDAWPLRTPKDLVKMRLDGAPWLERIKCDGEFCLYQLR